MFSLLVFLLFAMLGIVCIIGLFFYFSFKAIYMCKKCSQKIDSTQVVCNFCGAFVENDKAAGKAINFMNNHLDYKFKNDVKKRL